MKKYIDKKGATSINETLAEGLANRVMRGVSSHEFISLDIDEMPRRKQIREAIKYVKKDLVHVYLGSVHKETSKWEAAFGGWSATSTYAVPITEMNELIYDRLGFDFYIDTPTNGNEKQFFISLSKHALERLILRKKPIMSTYKDVISYLNTIIKPLVINCLDLIKRNPSSCNTEVNALVGGFVFPIAMEIGINKNRKIIYSFVIKTVMPEHYDGAKQLLSHTERPDLKCSIEEYWPVFYRILRMQETTL